jgi:hypothetical protein
LDASARGENEVSSLLAYAFRTGEPVDLAGFRRLAGLHGQLGDMTAACFLLYQPPEQQTDPNGRRVAAFGVADFLSYTVPQLLPQLNRTTQLQRMLLQGQVRGRVDWDGTYKARYSADGNPAIFVCRQSGRRYDRPENQLLKFVLDRIQACLNRVSPEMRIWFAWKRPRDGSERQRVVVGVELAEIAHRVRLHLGSVYLREVSLPESIGEAHLRAVRTAKNPLYGDVLQIYRLYVDIVAVSKWRSWKGALDDTAPLPPPERDEVARLLLMTPP